MKISKKEFSTLIKQVTRRDTSADPEKWTASNPLWGHCAVVSLLAQDYFGGDLVRASLKHIPQYSYLRSHYWNRLPDGSEEDFTGAQFNNINSLELEGVVRERERVLNYPDTQKRYSLLAARFKAFTI